MKTTITEEISRIKQIMLIKEGFGDEAAEVFSSLWNLIRRSNFDVTRLQTYSNALEREFANIEGDVASQIRNLAKDLGVSQPQDSFYTMMRKILTNPDVITGENKGKFISLILRNPKIEKEVTTNLLNDSVFMEKLARDVDMTQSQDIMRYKKIDTKLDNLGLPKSIKDKLKSNIQIFAESSGYKNYSQLQKFLNNTFKTNWGSKVFSFKPQDISYGVDDFLNQYANGSYKDLSPMAKKTLLKPDKMNQIMTNLDTAVKNAGNDISKVNMNNIFEKSLKDVLGDVRYDYDWVRDNVISRAILFNSKGTFSPIKFFSLLTLAITVGVWRSTVQEYGDNQKTCIENKLTQNNIVLSSFTDNEQIDILDKFAKECETDSTVKTSSDMGSKFFGIPVGLVKGFIEAIGSGVKSDRNIYDEIRNKQKEAKSTITTTYTDDLDSFKKWMKDQKIPNENSAKMTKDPALNINIFEGNGMKYKFCKSSFILTSEECK